MDSKPWSTFSRLSFAAVAALCAFYAGRLSLPSAPASLGRSAEMAIKPHPSLILDQPVKAAAAAAPRRTEDPATRWAELCARPATPAGESEQADWIEKLARQDPQRAIALAAGQNNLRLRAALLRAAMKGWGATNPEAAVAWAQTETVMDHAQAINALLQGAVQDPDQAASVTAELIKNDSNRATEYGGDLISALTEAGQFERAANFAASGAASSREDWMLPAYSRWAEFQPQAAVASAMQIADAGVREAALNAIIVGWSPTDPKAMVEFAQNNLPAGQQDSALSSAIGFWADSDPAAAALWINQNNPGPQTDSGVAEIALSPQLARKPEVAVTWAESILNPQLRSETLQALLEKWAAFDFSSAENYVENSPALAPEDRAAYLSKLTAPMAP